MHLWDDCLELEAHIRSNNVHNIYKLDRVVLKIAMLGETSDISQFCKLEWFKWVTLLDETAPCPEHDIRLGCFLGPCKHISPAMTITQNEHMLHRLTLR